jgi:hypothetical protein
MRLARETGEVLVSDVSGGLYLLNRMGKVQSLIRTRHAIQRVAWSDAGVGGAAAFDNQTVVWFDRKLQLQWTRELDDNVLCVSVDPFGTHLAISTADGVTSIYTTANRRVSRFETIRPLRYSQFLTNEMTLLAAAEHGLVGRYSMRGDAAWSEKLWSNVGDLAATGDGRTMYLAGFAHGIMAYDGESGVSRGTFVTDGTVGLLTCPFAKKSLVGATLERQLFAIDVNGNATWNLTAPEDVQRIAVSPLGDWIVVGFASGRIVRLDCGR